MRQLREALKCYKINGMDHIIEYQTLAQHLECGFYFPFYFRCRKTKDIDSTWHTKGKEQVTLLAGESCADLTGRWCPQISACCMGWGWCAAGGQTSKGQGGQWENCLGCHKLWEVYAQDFGSATEGGLDISGKPYIVAYHSKGGTTHAVYVCGVRGATVLLDFKEKFLWGGF